MARQAAAAGTGVTAGCGDRSHGCGKGFSFDCLGSGSACPGDSADWVSGEDACSVCCSGEDDAGDGACSTAAGSAEGYGDGWGWRATRSDSGDEGDTAEVCGYPDCAAEGSSAGAAEDSDRAHDRGAERCEDGEQHSADRRCEFADCGYVDGKWRRDRAGIGSWCRAWT